MVHFEPGVAAIWVPMRLDIHALMLITECGRRAVSARARSRVLYAAVSGLLGSCQCRAERADLRAGHQ